MDRTGYDDHLVILAFGGDMYFLLSAAIPHKAIYLGMYFIARMPADYYIDETGGLSLWTARCALLRSNRCGDCFDCVIYACTDEKVDNE